MRQLTLHIDNSFAVLADTNSSAHTRASPITRREELRLEPPQSVFNFSCSRPSSLRPLTDSKPPTPFNGSVSRACKMEGTTKSPLVQQQPVSKVDRLQPKCPDKIEPSALPPPLIVDTLHNARESSKCVYDKDGKLTIQTLHRLGIPVSTPIAEHKVTPSMPQLNHKACISLSEPSTQLIDPPCLASKIAIAAPKLPDSGLNCGSVPDGAKTNGNGSKVKTPVIIPPLEPATRNRKSRFFPAVQSTSQQVDKSNLPCAPEIPTDNQGVPVQVGSEISATRTEEIKKILTEIRQQKMQEARERGSPISPYMNDVTLARQIDEIEKARSTLTASDAGIPAVAGEGKQAADIGKSQGSRTYGLGQPLKWVPRNDSESSEEERNDWEWV